MSISSSFLSSGAGDGDHLTFSDFLDDILLDFPPQNPNRPVHFSSGSDDNNNNNSTPKTNTSSSGSGSDDGENPNWEIKITPAADEQRRRRRKVSNRESARRSRLRKQKHLESLRARLDRYQAGSRELMNRLMFVNHHGQIFRRENQRLRSESMVLKEKLCYLYQALMELELNHHHHPLSTSAWPSMQ